MTARWVRFGELDSLASGTLGVFRHDGRQLAVGRSEDGRPFAVDNRCPHEGYPLVQGELKGCVLTCAWHNWKFDVQDGRCLLGGEGVRSYPVRVVDGAIEIDVAEPDPARVQPAMRASLEEAMHKADLGRGIRDAIRLLATGYDPWRLCADVAAYDARVAEYGTTHVLALAADCGRMLRRHAGLDATLPIAQVIDLCLDENARLPARAVPEALAGATRDSLRSAVESEDAARAEGLLRGAFAAGVARSTVESWLYAILSDHFGDFGHELIYLVKAQELLAEVDPSYAAALYPALLYATVLQTREDTLPYMRPYFRRLSEVQGELAVVYERSQAGAPFDAVALREAVLDAGAAEAFDAMWSALRGGASAAAVARALVAAAAQRLYRFDLDVERSVEVQESWLWATHRLTFASAVRNAVERFREPAALRFLVHALAFVHSGSGMDAPPERRLAVVPARMRVEDIVEAVVHRDAARAVGGAAAHLQSGEPVAPLREALEDLCLRDPLVRPIFVAHAVKTTVAAFDEHEALAGEPDRDWPVLAAVRFLASPVVERRIQRAVRTSIRWVAEGVVPRKLTQ